MDYSNMTEGQLRKAEAKAEIENSNMIITMIANGRGHERYSETMNKTDPLSLKFKLIANKRSAIYAEINRRKEYHGSLRKIKIKSF
jgi:hypothetical protein